MERFRRIQHIRYFCSKCTCEFWVEIRDENYNIEIKCPRCKHIIRKKEQE